jgi:hypothetical protein
MKKFFTLVAMAFMAISANAQAVIAEIDWTERSEYLDLWYSTDYATVTVEQGTGLIIDNASDGTTNYWEPQVPMIGHIPVIDEGGQYQVKFQFESPVAGELRLDFCSWDGSSATHSKIFDVAAGANDLTIDFEDYPTPCTDAMIFYQCGKLPGRHVIKKVQVIDLEAGEGGGGEQGGGSESETSLWEGSVLVNGWADQPYMLSDGGAELTAAGAAAGDKIRVYASAPDDSWVVEVFNGHWDGMIERFSAVALTEEDGSPRESSIFDLATTGYFEFTITDEFLTLATTPQGWGGAFLLNGDGNLTATKVTLVKGGATGIQNVQVKKATDNAIYNLAGQKVNASYKGIVIKNGKKYIQK